MISEKEFIELLKKHTDYNLDYWNPDKFNWEEHSWALCEHCSEYFNIWWDSDKFNWEDSSWALCRYCSEHFDKWWDPDKFNWEKSSYILCKCCSDHLEIWIKDYIKNNPDSSASFILQKLNTDILQRLQTYLFLENFSK